jgi:uncharacterized membrane protein
MEQKDLLRIARRRAAAKFGFMIHLTVFVAVNALLYFANQSTSPGVSWFAFPLGGWGLGLAIHGLVVFASVSGLHERMVEGELAKLRATGAPAAGPGTR